MTFNATPQTVFFAHVARIAGVLPEGTYSTETGVLSRNERFLIAHAETTGVTEEFCFVCSRCTEHDDAQLLAFARTAKGRAMMERASE